MASQSLDAEIEFKQLRPGALARLQGALEGIAPPVTAAPPASQLQVLVADEDPSVAALVAATLKSHGIRCQIARHGKQALEMARRLQPAAVVLEILLPQINGFEVLAALKSDPATAGVPVVLLTARQQEADVLRAFGLGAEDYITKPFNPMELVARLRRVMRPAARAIGA